MFFFPKISDHPTISSAENQSLRTIAGNFNVDILFLGITDAGQGLSKWKDLAVERLQYKILSVSTLISATKGKWVDFDGNPFGIGKADSYIQEPGRYQNWRKKNGKQSEPTSGSNENYVVMELSANWGGTWNDHYDYHLLPLICQAPLSKFMRIKFSFWWSFDLL